MATRRALTRVACSCRVPWLLKSDVIVDQRRLLGRPVHYFSSSHERSHLLCAFGMSSLPKGTPCYALVWEGAIGAFYEIDSAA